MAAFPISALNSEPSVASVLKTAADRIFNTEFAEDGEEKRRTDPFYRRYEGTGAVSSRPGN
jgi:hypothetical protein